MASDSTPRVCPSLQSLGPIRGDALTSELNSTLICGLPEGSMSSGRSTPSAIFRVEARHERTPRSDCEQRRQDTGSRKARAIEALINIVRSERASGVRGCQSVRSGCCRLVLRSLIPSQQHATGGGEYLVNRH